MLLTADEAKKILAKALTYTKADEAEVSLSGSDAGNLRFARNRPTTSGASYSLSLSATCVFGKRMGSFSTTDMSDSGLSAAMQHAEQAAKFAPESPEYMSRLALQHYVSVNQVDQDTTKFSPASRVKIAAEAINEAGKQNLQSAGYWADGDYFNAFMNSKGGFGFHRSTGAHYTLTVRTEDGKGSGWAADASFRASDIDPKRIANRAITKAMGSRGADLIPPGPYTVILEPSAVGDMLNLFRDSLDRRAADEGRNFHSGPNGTTRLGEKLFGDNITIYSDPTDAHVPAQPWGDDGLPLGKTTWVDKGTLKNLYCGRYWAEQKGYQPLPYGSNVIMLGGNDTLEQMIASTKKGLLVTSFWYIREVDPQTIMHTGLTRDGLFLIEDGKIKMPVHNMRWNESPAAVFKGIEMMSAPERIVTREGNQPMLAPAIKVKEFNFTSTSPST